MSSEDGHRENPGQCQCCGFVTKELIEFPCYPKMHDPQMTPESKWYWLCGLCKNGPGVGRLMDYGRVDEQTTLAAIYFVANRILAEIRKGRAS